MDAAEQRPIVSTYYGTTLQTSADLKTSACCPVDAVPPAHRAILSTLHPDVTARFYGCGSPIPPALAGQVVLDLGCGTGRDAFLAAALAGARGRVIGVDMTDAQLAVARATEQFHADLFFGPGAAPTTDFRRGYIEDLRAAGVADGSVGVVISNCVCNLSTDKLAVFAEVARVLACGGEFYFSDVYADRRLPLAARRHPTLVAECLGGALYLDDFRRVMARAGFNDLRVVSSAPVHVQDPELRALVPGIAFYSVTIRAFKVDGLEDRRENYGQFATYESSSEESMRLDSDFTFERNVKVPVDSNTAAILQASRFKSSFTVTPKQAHLGQFFPQVEAGALAASVYTAEGKVEPEPEPKAACCPARKPAAVEKKGAPCCPPAQPGAVEKKGASCGAGAPPPPVPSEEGASSCCASGEAKATEAEARACGAGEPHQPERSDSSAPENGTRETNGCCVPSTVVDEPQPQNAACAQRSGCC